MSTYVQKVKAGMKKKAQEQSENMKLATKDFTDHPLLYIALVLSALLSMFVGIAIDEVVRARELISSKPVKVVTLDPLAAQALRNNEADMKKLNIENVKLGLINPKKLAKGHRYIGQITMSGIDIYELQDTYKDEAGVLQNLLPAGTAIFGPGDDEFITGPVSLYAEDTSEEPVTSVKPRVPNVMIAPNKRSKIIETLSRQMPMPADLDAYAVATVL